MNANSKQPMWVICADCWKRHDANALPSHECKEQRAANRRAQRKAKAKQ